MIFLCFKKKFGIAFRKLHTVLVLLETQRIQNKQNRKKCDTKYTIEQNLSPVLGTYSTHTSMGIGFQEESRDINTVNIIAVADKGRYGFHINNKMIINRTPEAAAAVATSAHIRRIGHRTTSAGRKCKM